MTEQLTDPLPELERAVAEAESALAGVEDELAAPECWSSPERSTMSFRTNLSAVAVRAITGMLGKSCLRRAILRYSGRKSCPKLEMQCASSIANSETLIPLKKSMN